MPLSISTEEELQERIKELSCLYDISSILAKQETLSSRTLASIGDILRQAWRFSTEAKIEIQIDTNHYLSDKFSEKNYSAEQ